jgi:hypothetical protein
MHRSGTPAPSISAVPTPATDAAGKIHLSLTRQYQLLKIKVKIVPAPAIEPFPSVTCITPIAAGPRRSLPVRAIPARYAIYSTTIDFATASDVCYLRPNEIILLQPVQPDR